MVWMRPAAIALALMVVGLAGCFGGNEQASKETDEPLAPLISDPLPVNDTITPPAPVALPWYPNDGASVKTFLEVATFDDHLIPVTVYKPAIANESIQFPVLVQSHGFTGSKWSTDDRAEDYIAAGFGVVSYDQRGHGDARDDSDVRFMHPDYEVRDAIALLDEISSWDWVLMENETTRDPVLGGIGYSYGGAFQLMTATFDDRLDAIVPEITWHNITTALAPGGAIKSGWVDLFYLAGNAQQSVVFSEDFHKGWTWATASNELPAGQFGQVPDLVDGFNRASPEYYPGAIDIPTLLVQGMPDTLFPLNQAVWNHLAINATGAPTWLYTHNAGHILNTESLAAGVSPIPAGLQGVPGGRPCGEQADLEIRWHQKWLLGLDVDLGPRFCISLEDDTAIVGNEWPLPSTEMRAFELGGPFPIIQGAGGGSAIPLELVTVDAETIVAGIPTIKGSIMSPGADSIVYFSLQMARTDGIMEHIVDDQVRPLRTLGPNTGAVDFEMELGGIGTRLAAGDTLYLMVSSIEPMFFGNAERLAGGVVLDGLTLELPVVTEPVFRS